LRPIGDFFGFIMRPIMVMMLRKFIIPWYKDVYPVMKKLGTWIGNQVVPTVEKIFTAGTPENSAAIAAAAVIPSLIIAKKILPKILPTATVAAVVPSKKVPKVKTPSPAFPAPKAKPPIFKLPAIKLPPAIQKGLVKLATIPAVLKSGVTNAVVKSASLLKNIVTPITTAMSSPAMLKAAADIVKIAPKVLKFAIKPVPIIGWGLAGIDVAGSAMKEFAPEQYEGIRQGALGLGKALGDTEGKTTEGILDFMGFGTKSTAEQLGEMASPYLGSTTGIGGGAGIARGAAGAGVTIFIDHVSNEADIQRMGNVMQEKLLESNKRTVKSY